MSEPIGFCRPFSIALCLASVPLIAQAHHSWRAVYDGGEPVTVEAVVTSEVSRNPHLTVRVQIVNEAGEAERWTIEWRGGRRRNGTRVDYDLEPGDAVVIDGRIARDPSTRKIQMQTLTRAADGTTIVARRRGEGRRR